MPDETRRVDGSWELIDASGQRVDGGTSSIVVDEGRIVAGAASVDWLDADVVRSADWSVEIDIWPAGRMRLTQLGRRFETFVEQLRSLRNEARVSGMLAHGIDPRERFRGTADGADSNLIIYSTHLTVVPDDGDPYQIAFGDIRDTTFDETSWTTMVRTASSQIAFGALGQSSKPFLNALLRARDEGLARIRDVAKSPLFVDGVGVDDAACRSFDACLRIWRADERVESSEFLMSKSGREARRIGLAEMLEIDGESLSSSALPPNIAAFLLVVFGRRVVLEIVSGPGAASYVFDGDIEQIESDLRQIHFRRRPLMLTDDQLAAPVSEYRLAARRLEALKRLRSATRARVIHDDAWSSKIDAALSNVHAAEIVSVAATSA